jgi:hypothetical protein
VFTLSVSSRGAVRLLALLFALALGPRASVAAPANTAWREQAAQQGDAVALVKARALARQYEEEQR